MALSKNLATSLKVLISFVLIFLMTGYYDYVNYWNQNTTSRQYFVGDTDQINSALDDGK